MSSIYLSNAVFMMVILTIILLRIRYYITWSPSKKYAMIFIGVVELYVLLDALFMREFLSKTGSILQFKLIVFFFYLVYVIMPYVWHLFMQNYMGISSSKKRRFVEMIPLLLLTAMVLLSVPTGIVWGFSRNRTYIRGTFFGVFAVLNLFYYFYAFAQTFCILFMNNTEGIKYLIKSALFSAIPLIGIVPDDENIVIATNQGEPLVGNGTPAGIAFQNICHMIRCRTGVYRFTLRILIDLIAASIQNRGNTVCLPILTMVFQGRICICHLHRIRSMMQTTKTGTERVILLHDL